MLGNDRASVPQTAVSAPAADQRVSIGPKSGVKSSHQHAAAAQEATPWVLVGLLFTYIAWALIEKREGIRKAVQPSAIAINLRNFGVVTLMVVIGLNLFKIAFVKLAAWKVPGAKTFLKVLGGA